MKTIKAYLENQKEIAAANLYTSLDKNLIDAKFWLERIIHVDTMLKSLDNGKEKAKN